MSVLIRLLLTVSAAGCFLETALAQYNPPNAIPPIPPPRLLSPSTANTNSVSTLTGPVTPINPATTSGLPTSKPATASETSEVTPSKNAVLPPNMDMIDNKRPLVMGDVINYRVTEDQDPPRSLQVNESGEIEVPLLGRLPAAGKTLQKLANEIKTLLEKDYYYQATVLLSMDMMARSAAKRMGKIYVVGQIRSPGAQEIPEDETFTVSKAILRAGGFGDFADKRKVKLVRKKEGSKEPETTIVDCTLVFDKGDTSNDPVVKAEDLIIVPQRLINF